MRIIILFTLLLLLLFSCKKEVAPQFNNYSETRSAVRAYLELSAMIDCAARVMDSISTDKFVYIKKDNNPLTSDTLLSDKGPINNDGKIRAGKFMIHYLGNIKDTACEFNLEFNYKRDEMVVSGNLKLKRGEKFGQSNLDRYKKINGNLNLAYINQTNCNINVDMKNWFKATGQYYTGVLKGTISDGNSFESNVTNNPIISRKCLESTVSEDVWEQFGTRILMSGESSFTTSNQGKGRIWFGSQTPDCDKFAVADWLDKNLQLYMNLDDY